MNPPIPMHEMSKLEFVLNNPEWAGVIASTIFAAVTAGIIFWQVCVMIWQGRNSDQHERGQNRLIRLQHEHEWVWRRNQERGQLLKLGWELHRAVGSVADDSGRGLEIRYWHDVLDAAHELDSRLNVLDVATFSGEHDDWFPGLREYSTAVLNIVIEKPRPETVKKLEDEDKRLNPTGIFLGIESAIRMDYFDFKNKWDAETSNV